MSFWKKIKGAVKKAGAPFTTVRRSILSPAFTATGQIIGAAGTGISGLVSTPEGAGSILSLIGGGMATGASAGGIGGTLASLAERFGLPGEWAGDLGALADWGAGFLPGGALTKEGAAAAAAQPAKKDNTLAWIIGGAAAGLGLILLLRR